MGEWKECKLGEVLNLKRGYDLPKRLRKNGDIPIFSSSGISGFHNKSKVEGVGVITGRYGTIGKVFLAQQAYWPLNTTLYVENFKNNNEFFVYYFLQGINWEKFNDKSAVPGINRNDVHEENVLLPSLPEQKAIASTLSCLDDKIDLLHRQNKTLEAMAETLFRQWFIEEAEDDWEEKSLYDCIKLIGGGTPKTSIDEYWNGDIGWLSAKDITPNHKSIVLSTEKTITTEGLNNSSTKILPQFSTIISARGTVGKYAILAENMAFSQSNYGIIPEYQDCYFFTYLLVANVVDQLISAAYGSVFDTITTKTFKEHSVTVPLEKEIINFEKEISPIFFKILNNAAQIRTLENLRNTLLPKLMSGEVRVRYD
ncbi:MAG: restriction endonuclease subunit S [Candidatus Electrothrix sp. GW3-4]|uniref:restriction endonuclease subunit S n=1 Tax=Candidatus Electrothrix sp. GW3-4 TaxID=3126740 RepID=UPI0030CB052D